MTDDQLVTQYAHLVKKIAHHIMARLPASIQIEDLIQAGMIGLLEAAKNFKTDKGASFETYAGIRIRGSILDEMRRGDWTPRSVHRNSRKVAKAVNVIENLTGRDARSTDVAEYLGASMQEYHQMMQDSTSVRVFAFEDVGINPDVMPENFGSINMNCPLNGAEQEEFRIKLAKCILKLPQREQLVLSLYYEEEMNLREVGEVLGVSESRISQSHGQAMSRLQQFMNTYTKEDEKEIDNISDMGFPKTV